MVTRVDNQTYMQMTQAQRDAYHDKRRREQNDVDRKRLLKIPMFLTREFTDAHGQIQFLIIKRHVNKSCAGLFAIHQKIPSFWQNHWAHYQAPGVQGKYTGFYFEKGHDFHEYPPTILQDLHDYAHGDLTPLEDRYGGQFDQSRFQWEL